MKLLKQKIITKRDMNQFNNVVVVVVGLGNKYSKAKAMESLKKDKTSTIVSEKTRDSSLTSSSGFFTKLQDSVREELQKNNQSGKKEKKNKTSSAHCKL